jgi:SAM-dependent methyltransferase
MPPQVVSDRPEFYDVSVARDGDAVSMLNDLQYRLLRRFWSQSRPLEVSTAYVGTSKLEVLFGSGIWQAIRGRTVLDFGCGLGEQVVELAGRGAAHVIGLDINQELLQRAARNVAAAGVAGKCTLVSTPPRQADLVLSLDCFEHFGDPAGVLRTMASMLQPGGEVWISFGPPWFHPLGGHLFSVFPWAHLVFSEAALLRWRADFKPDKGRSFEDVGLNRMTVRRFRRLVEESPFRCLQLEPVPIRRLHWLASPVTREFTTAIVRCRLALRSR